jgi:hypothetical protein
MLSEDSDTEQPVQLTINEHYAKAYAYRKEREELGRRAYYFYIYLTNFNNSTQSKKSMVQMLN